MGMTVDDFCFASGVVALTGGIGSGKSSVGRWLRDNAGYSYISADDIVAALLEPHSCGGRQLRDVLQPDFFLADGSLDKASLRRSIFSDIDLRSTVQDVLHPLVFQKIKEVLLKNDNNKKPYLVEVPLLFEAGWQRYFKTVIVVYAARETCLSRLQDRDGVGSKDAAAAFRAQIPLKKKVSAADYIIDNTNTWPETIIQIKKLQKELDTCLAIS